MISVDQQFHIYDLSTMKLEYNIADSGLSTPFLACSISCRYIAYRVWTDPNSVIIFDADNHSTLRIAEAHRSPVSVAAFSPDCTLIATASEKVLAHLPIPIGNHYSRVRFQY